MTSAYMINHTPQSAFDAMVRAFAKQDWVPARSELADGSVACHYRKGTSGCAVGVLLPDAVAAACDAAARSPIGVDLGTLIADNLLVCSSLALLEFLYDAQRRHDKTTDLSKEMQRLGVKYELNWPADVPVPA